MKKILLVPALMAMSFGISSSAHATPTCPPVINPADYTVGGVFNVDAYLAALGAALGECNAHLPKTGSSDSSQLLTIGLGLSSVGLIAAAPAIRRRRRA
jgi:LPXTG-motif cell wall-anchored protein